MPARNVRPLKISVLKMAWKRSTAPGSLSTRFREARPPFFSLTAALNPRHRPAPRGRHQVPLSARHPPPLSCRLPAAEKFMHATAYSRAIDHIPVTVVTTSDNVREALDSHGRRCSSYALETGGVVYQGRVPSERDRGAYRFDRVVLPNGGARGTDIAVHSARNR